MAKTKKRILVNLEKFYKSGLKGVRCSYFYSSRGPHKMTSADKDYRIDLPPENNGVEKLLAKTQQYLVCRRCEEEFCVNACPREALEKDENGVLQRHLFRCSSCKTCSMACPFGTIYPELLNFRSSQCDYCEGRSDDSTPPECVKTCSDNILEFVEVDGKNEEILIINEHLAVRAPKWNAGAGGNKK